MTLRVSFKIFPLLILLKQAVKRCDQYFSEMAPIWQRTSTIAAIDIILALPLLRGKDPGLRAIPLHCLVKDSEDEEIHNILDEALVVKQSFSEQS